MNICLSTELSLEFIDTGNEIKALSTVVRASCCETLGTILLPGPFDAQSANRLNRTSNRMTLFLATTLILSVYQAVSFQMDST